MGSFHLAFVLKGKRVYVQFLYMISFAGFVDEGYNKNVFQS